MAASVARDLAALNKIELLPFDYWGVMNEISMRREVSDENAALIDQIAEVTCDEGFDLHGLRTLYRSISRVRVSDPITSWPQGVECDFHLRLGLADGR